MSLFSNGCVSVASQAAKGYGIASRGRFSVITAVYQAAEDKPNGLNVEWGPRYLSSMFVCGAAQWIKLERARHNLKSSTSSGA